MTPTHEQYIANFWARVYKHAPNGCWLWTGCLDSWERGVMTRFRRRVFAHRLSWELAYGPPLKGLFICHTCDIRACVNPLHLFLGTAADNNWDRARKFRTGKTKLTRDKVIAMRGLFGKMQQKDIATLFGVSQGTVSSIKRRLTYAHAE